jgi:hypothetical protein
MNKYDKLYTVIDTFLPHEILKHVDVHDSWIFAEEWVDLTSYRYRNYKYNSLECSCCGVKGLFFCLEKAKRGLYKYRQPHFNLYGLVAENEPIMMTIDHITPKSLGGSNDVDNLHTMCEKCNFKKGNKDVAIPNYIGFLRSNTHQKFLKKVIK